MGTWIEGTVGVGVELEGVGVGLEVGVAVGEVWIFGMLVPGGRVGGEEARYQKTKKSN